MSLDPPAFVPLGDAAVLIVLGDAIDAATHERVVRVLTALDADPADFIIDVVPAYTSIAVHYDAAALARRADPFAHVCDELRRRVAVREVVTDAGAEGRLIEIPVHYGGTDGPDLEHVAQLTALSPADVVALHAGSEYRVYMIGFAPGFPYMAGLPPQLAVPRHSVPRTRVPAGSVAIAGAQTGIYPLATPGGWQIIGRTDVQLFRPSDDPPTLLQLGDRVRFVVAE